MTSITVSDDVSDRFGPARDQLGRETCLAFAVSDAHAAKRGAPWQSLSCEYLFYFSKLRETTAPHVGVRVASIRAALESDGQPLEAGWPYLNALPTPIVQWIPPGTMKSVYKRHTLVHKPSFKTVWDAIESGDAVVVGISISDAFYLPTEGVVDSNEALDPARKHAVVATATGANAQGQFLKVRNSWGPTWGDAGYAWVSKMYIEPRLIAVITID